MLRRLLELSQEIQVSVAERKGEPQHLVEDAERRLFEIAHAENARRLPLDRGGPARARSTSSSASRATASR